MNSTHLQDLKKQESEISDAMHRVNNCLTELIGLRLKNQEMQSMYCGCHLKKLRIAKWVGGFCLLADIALNIYSSFKCEQVGLLFARSVIIAGFLAAFWYVTCNAIALEKHRGRE